MLSKVKKEIPHIHQQLVAAARANERNAQSELYKLYFKAIYNSSLRIVGDSFVAEDLMQDAFIDAFKNMELYDAKSTFGAWIKKIVINKSINYLKKQQLIAEKLEDYSTIDDDLDEYEFEFNVDDVKKASQQLSPQYKLVFSLYMIEGYDHDEISEIMSISSSTSRSQLSRAKQQLIKILTQAKYEVA